MEHFNSQAKEWDNDPKKVERATFFANEIQKIIQPNTSWNALELGAGTGLLSYYLKDSFNNIILTDTSEGMIAVLKEKIEAENLKNFTPLLADILVDNLVIEKVDVIYTMMTLHHILDLKNAAIKLNSLLKPNGYLCIVDLVEEDGSFHSNFPDFNGHNGFNKKAISTLFIENNFQIEHYSVNFEIEKTKNSVTRKYPLFLLICKKVDV